MGDVAGGSQTPGNYPGSPPAVAPARSKLSNQGASEHPESTGQYRDGPAETVQHAGQVLFQVPQQHPFVSAYQTRQNPPGSFQANMAPSAANLAQQVQQSGRGSFNMASLAAGLPDKTNYGQDFVQQSSHRFPPGQSQAAIAYQLHQAGQVPGQMAMNQPTNPSHSMQYGQQYQGRYAHQQGAPQIPQPGLAPGQFIPSQGFMSPSQQLSPYFYQQGQYPPQVYPTGQASAYGAQYGTRNPMSGETATFTDQQRATETRGGPSGQVSGSLARAGSTASTSGGQSMLRGPPRKPKQSGHALWVGNLPPGANVVDLKDHFSRDATDDILSVFLISKSNCAFVNYKTEESCAAAMTRFHDSRFQGVRLVCRLRRSSVNAAPGVPTGPAAASASQPPPVEHSPQIAKTISQEPKVGAEANDDTSSLPSAKDKYFIVKSLTIEDLELSVRNGVWATQSHNESVLNKAYEAVDNVYLIFSANKSGEYFGYARMASPINDDLVAVIEFAPKAQTVEDPDLPKAIPTPATGFAPKGRIIDDSARGTIFWEAEINEVDSAGEAEDQHSDHSDQELDGASTTKAWGKPFKIEWLSTNRLPFYRTRGLRNPWNSNREVKIARDGTELETSIGRRLIQMFHREASPTTTTMPMQMPPMIGGYPQMRPY